jgi:hypothetical protein
MAEAFRNYREAMRAAGVSTMGKTQKDFEKWAREQSKTSAQRKREEEKAASGPGGGGGGAGSAANPVAEILTFLISKFDDFKERVPQNALS